MSEDSTQNMDDVNVNDSEFNNPMDEAIDTLLDNAVDSGALRPAYDEEDEASTQEVEEITEELEDEIDVVDEDAEDVGDEEVGEVSDEEEVEDDVDLPEGEVEEEEGELDMEYMVPIKVDGEESEVSMEELIKGYQTSQHQTKKGQELAEQAKELEQVKNDNNIFLEINQNLLQAQDQRDLSLLKQRKDVMDKMAKDGFVEGVDDDLSTLQYKFNDLKDEYFKRKADRDATTDQMLEAAQTQYQENMQGAVESFQTEITNHVPDWSQEIAQENYQFAIDSGLPEELVATVTDPAIAAFIDEFRRLKTSASKGAVKRKKAPVKKIPTKKAVPQDMKKKGKTSEARKRLSKGKGSDKDLKTLNDNIYDDIFGDSKLF